MGARNVKPQRQSVEPDVQPAINKLRRQIQVLTAVINHKNTLITEYTRKARECVSQNKKDQAKMILQNKVVAENRVRELCNMITVLETQINALESVDTNRNIIAATQAANSAMKTADVGEVSNLMDDVRENMNNVQDITNVLCEPLGPQVDVTNELESMAAELPAAPTHQPLVVEKELEKLAIAM